ncbi:MAG: tetratricopeptide repeat protein [Planctomycetes bacterium]|nr:tetratricopeptide repeat protein [Planctomycetota bacterium]
MVDQTVGTVAPALRVSVWQHVATAVLVLGFMAIGWLRLNDCDLFNPDSPRYLIYAQSLADSGQYRAIDTPGAPLYTWRPPGLPILLAPVLKFFPYDVIAAKCVVLATGALLLLVLHAIVSSTRGGWSGPLMVAVTGTSPMFLSLATEVLTEVPYSLGILAALYGLGRWNNSPADAPRWPAYTVALMALAFTPIIRTVGVALVAAVGLWSLTARRRWRFLPAVAVAVAGLIWLSWRSRLAAGNNYAGSLLQSIREHGLSHVIAEAFRTLSYYTSAVPGVLLPGMTTEQPFFAPMAIGPLPSLTVPGLIVAFLAWSIIVIAVAGLWQQRSRAGVVGGLYLMLYCACLAIWPWRHERFLWPLVPLVWAFVPAGCRLIGRMLPMSMRTIALPGIVAALMALCGWQACGDAALIAANQRFLADRDGFYQQEAPGFYFSDWRQAGRWIRENSSPHARLLTWQAAVGGTAHRFQRRVQFEALTPEKVRQQIASFPARYLVVTTAQFGLGFGWQQAFADPSYRLTVVYQNRDVAVLEVSPNRTGNVSRTGYAEWLQTQRTALDEVLARSPNRLDLIARKADLLQEAGETSQAIQLLEDLVQRGVVTVRVCSSLGWLYLSTQQYAKAAEFLDLARGLPNAEPVAESLADGARQARKRLTESADESLEKTIERSLHRIQNQVAALNLPAAEREVDGLLPKVPDHAALNYWRGYLHHLFGESELAEKWYEVAVRSGSEDARGKLLLLRLERALTRSAATVINLDGASEPVDPATFGSHVRLAKLYDEHGWSGRAVATLESARQKFGDQPEILSPLADLYLRFARPEEAAPLYRRALEEWPHEKSVQQGQAAAAGALRQPKY